MKKDTIYIDVEDDITAIIGKVKDAKHKIVALVPPKRTGVLRSAVNLRLLDRAAKHANKQLVLISGNKALTALAASANIPSARTLQSKPQLAKQESDEEVSEDVIDGADLPVEEDEKAAGGSAKKVGGAAASALAVDEAISANAAEDTIDDSSKEAVPAKAVKKSQAKVPSFNVFRRRFAAAILGLVLLIGFLVWAVWFAPYATIEIAARTMESSANAKVALSSTAATSFSNSTIKTVRQQLEKDVSVNFDATGERNVGEFAKGAVTFSSDSISALLGGVTIPAGTTLTVSGGSTYTTDTSVTLTVSNNSGSTNITATGRGERFNGARGSASGAPRRIDAQITSATTGGTDRVVKIVTQADIDAARESALATIDRNAARQELVAQFGENFVVIGDSLQVNTEALRTNTPADAEPTNGQASYGGKAVYSLYAVAEGELNDYLKAVFERQIEDNERQRVYETGVESARFTEVQPGEGQGAFSATVVATATLGPRIDDEKIKSESKGKRYGEVQQVLEQIPGVEGVDVRFSYFWVRTVPSEDDRITVEFKLNESKQE